MINAAILIGEPLKYLDKCLIYPPKVKDVVSQNSIYPQAHRLLTLTQEDIQDQLKDTIQPGEVAPTPFQFLFANAVNSQPFRRIAQLSFEFFLQEPVHFLVDEGKILIGNIEKEIQNASSLDELRFITEEDFFEFQNLIRLACGEKPAKPPEPIDPNEDPRIRRIKEKARERDRIKAKKGVQGGISLDTCLTAICCMGLGINPLNIGEMSYAAVGPLMKMMQEKEKYDIDVRSLLAGADSKKVKPKYWIRNSD